MNQNTFARIACGALAATLAAGASAPALAYPHGRYYDYYDDRPAYVAPPVQDYYYEDDYEYEPDYYTQDYYNNQYPAGGINTISCADDYNPLPFVLGAAAGGLLGSTIGKGGGNTAAIISGALIGGLVGNQYNGYDQRCTQQVFESVPTGTPVRWVNPNTNYDYVVTPTNDYERDGRYCREYQAHATVGSRVEDTFGTACMQPDGSWQIVN